LVAPRDFIAAKTTPEDAAKPVIAETEPARIGAFTDN